MRPFRTLRATMLRLAGFFRGSPQDRELDDELQSRFPDRIRSVEPSSLDTIQPIQ